MLALGGLTIAGLAWLWGALAADLEVPFWGCVAVGALIGSVCGGALVRLVVAAVTGEE